MVDLSVRTVVKRERATQSQGPAMLLLKNHMRHVTTSRDRPLLDQICGLIDPAKDRLMLADEFTRLLKRCVVQRRKINGGRNSASHCANCGLPRIQGDRYLRIAAAELPDHLAEIRHGLLRAEIIGPWSSCLSTPFCDSRHFRRLHRLVCNGRKILIWHWLLAAVCVPDLIPGVYRHGLQSYSLAIFSPISPR